MLLLTSVLCVVLSLELGVATPKGHRLKESNLQNEGNNEFNVERNTGEPTNSFNTPNNENELIYPENQRNVFMNYEDYENYANNNPSAFRNRNKKQPSVISESKDYNQNNADRNFNNFNEDSYIASLPQVNRMQSFRSKDEVINKANMPRRVDILSEVNNPNSDSSPVGSTPPIIQKRHHANQIMNKYNRPKMQTPKKFNDNKEEEETLSDVPVATPEYIKSLYNEDNQTKKNNIKPTMTNSPRNNISNKSFKQNSQNINEATFQNPSAEILYETGQAKPYEISNEPSNNSRQGQTNTQNILRDKQRLKNLYLSSKPTKHYMIVYPDGRVEQVDNLDKIQKVHRNYVMLNAKELLQHNPNVKNTASQGSVVKQNLMTTKNSNTKTQFNSIKVTKDEKIGKVTQTVNKQTLPVQNELPVATESPNISTKEVSTDNVVKSSEDQLKEDEINDSEEKNKLNDNENTNSGAILTTSDNSNNEVSNTSTTETPDTDDIVTTARSTISTPAPDVVILNGNNSLSTFNNTDNPNLSKEPESSNTSGDNLKNTKDDNVLEDENTTPTSKVESNEEKSVKNTTTITSDKENNNATDRIETVTVNNETISNSSSLYSSVNSKESNSSTKSNDETVLTSEDGTDSDGNTFHTETMVTNNTNESSAQNLESNNSTSSNSSTVVTYLNTTEIENSPTENTQNIMNITSSNSLTKKDENNTDTTAIQTLSNNTNSEANGTKNDDNNLKPYTPNNSSDLIYTNASSSNSTNEAKDVNNLQEESNSNKTNTNIKQDGSKLTDDDTGNSKAQPIENPAVPKEEDGKTVTDVSNNGKVSSNEEDSPAPDTASNDLSAQTGEDDEDDDTDANDNLDEESPSSNGIMVKESSFWFKANESFWNKLMNSNDHNSFYFLFPKPQPNIKETTKIIYPNGTVVVETTETIDNGDGETNSTKTVVTCRNCTTCDKTS